MKNHSPTYKMNVDEHWTGYRKDISVCVCNTNFWLGHPIFTDLSTDIFKNITFFNVPGYELWSTNTPIHMLAEYILDRVSTALNHFSSELEGVVLYNDRQSAWNSSIWKQMDGVGYYQKPISHQLWNFPHLW